MQVVPGDSVAWRNGDFVHLPDAPTARSTPAARPLRHASVQRFDAVGSHPFVCTIHPFMTGVVDVEAATLSGPATPVFAGEARELRAARRPGRPWSRPRRRRR